MFTEVSGELLEAAGMDGTPQRRTVIEVILPVGAPRLTATALICCIFLLERVPFVVNLTATQAATAATLPLVLAGWVAQRQRLAMGRAIVGEPKVFCMDEPLSNLDAQLQVQTAPRSPSSSAAWRPRPYT